ncbi:hypothetical protein ILFOPFJJ_06020 [Ensifer psoraleae]|nr:hypothetical protein [Sinorhizobium psoraleae]
MVGLPIGFEEDLLHIEVYAPMLIDHVVETKLQCGAHMIVDVEVMETRLFALVVEQRVVNARADIGLEGTEIGEVVLQRKRRRQQPGLPDRHADGTIFLDVGVGRAKDEFRGDVVSEEVADVEFRDQRVRIGKVRVRHAVD